jgi:hypothetical protein
MENQKYIIYFTDKMYNTKRVWWSDTKEITNLDKIPHTLKHFEVLQGYEASDDGLLKFVKDFHKFHHQFLDL